MGKPGVAGRRLSPAVGVRGRPDQSGYKKEKPAQGGLDNVGGVGAEARGILPPQFSRKNKNSPSY